MSLTQPIKNLTINGDVVFFVPQRDKKHHIPLYHELSFFRNFTGCIRDVDSFHRIG